MEIIDQSVINTKDIVCFLVDSNGFLATQPSELPLPEKSEKISHLSVTNSLEIDYSRCMFRIETELSQKSEIFFGATVRLTHVPTEMVLIDSNEIDSGYEDPDVQHNRNSVNKLRVAKLSNNSKNKNDDLCYKWIVTPKYKLREEGEPVRINDYVVLRNAQFNDLALAIFQVSNDMDRNSEHLTGLLEFEKLADRPGFKILRILRKEVIDTNIPSTEGVGNTLQIINGSEYIRLIHKQYGGHVICRVDDEQELKSRVAPFGSVCRKATGDKDNVHAIVVRSFDSQQPAQRYDFNTSFSGLGIWQIISVDQNDDNSLQGNITYLSMIRFRHVITGQYLAIRPVLQSDCHIIKEHCTEIIREIRSSKIESTPEIHVNQSVKFAPFDEKPISNNIDGTEVLKISILSISVDNLKLSSWLRDREVYILPDFASQLNVRTENCRVVKGHAEWSLESSWQSFIFQANESMLQEHKLKLTLFVKNSIRKDSPLGEANLSLDVLCGITDRTKMQLDADFNNSTGSLIGHGQVQVYLELLSRFDMDSVKFPKLQKLLGNKISDDKLQQLLQDELKFSVATSSTANEFTDFKIIALNPNADDPQGNYCKFGDNIILESPINNFRLHCLIQ